MKKQNPRTKILMLRNLITDNSAQDLVRGRQNGFIPMLLVFLLVIAAVIYFAYTRVLHNQK